VYALIQQSTYTLHTIQSINEIDQGLDGCAINSNQAYLITTEHKITKSLKFFINNYIIFLTYYLKIFDFV
jgi:hypothetical protein